MGLYNYVTNYIYENKAILKQKQGYTFIII